MKRIIFALLAVFFFSGCDISSNDIELKVSVVFSEGVTCRTYLADRFEIVLFDSNQKRTATKTFKCDSDVSTFSIFVPKEKYYLIVALKDKAGNNKSYGSGFVDATSSDVGVEIEMEEYKGGLTFEWGTSFCNRYGVGLLRFTLENEDEGVVSTIIWGKEEELKEYEMNCGSGYLEIVNIPSGMYSASVKAYRDSSSKRERMKFNIDEFKLTTGQQSILEIDDHKEIVVSDVTVKWDFDSRSIPGCSSTDIAKIITQISSGSLNETIEGECSDSDKSFDFFDISAGNYDINVQGVDSSGKVIFSGSKTERVEVGKIGSDAIVFEVYIVEE